MRFLFASLLALVVPFSSFAQEKKAKQEAQLPKDVLAKKNIAYVTGGHERQKLDLYLPKESKGPLPLLVWVHGGGWKQGSKDRCPALPWVAKGYAVASVNYRLSQHAVYPAQIEDCQSAICWLRDHAKENNIDPGRIAAWGASAGGHLVALLGTLDDSKKGTSYRVQAVIDYFGPTDLEILQGPNPGPASPITQLLGGSGEKFKKLTRQASPIDHVNKEDPPFLILHGDKDPLVPLNQSELLEKALKKAGVEVELVVLKGAAHGGAQFSAPEQIQTIDNFLSKTLKARK